MPSCASLVVRVAAIMAYGKPEETVTKKAASASLSK
jgi:hypothetical protein